MGDFAVILPAAGTSARFGVDRDKLLEPLEGPSVIVRSAQAFLSRRDVLQIIIPTRRPDLLAPELPRDERLSFCLGGTCRAESVRSGLAMVNKKIEWVAVHDAARPLISQGLIDRTLEAAQKHGAAVPALPVTLTIKQAPGPLPAIVEKTIPRGNLWSMQTPQIMRRESLEKAFAQNVSNLQTITDDMQLIESIGEPVCLIAGEEKNLKLTSPLDLEIAKAILRGAM